MLPSVLNVLSILSDYYNVHSSYSCYVVFFVHSAQQQTCEGSVQLSTRRLLQFLLPLLLLPLLLRRR